jgi:hypothetical protein
VPTWLVTPADLQSLSWEALVFRLLLAAVYGVCVAVVFQLSYGRHKPDGSVLITTLVLLSILVAMVSMVIGESVARAFSLVGALSIVRFRTVVEDTRDTVFVIFAVIVGMAAGAGSILVPLVGIPIVSIAAVLLSLTGTGGTSTTVTPESNPSTLSIRLGLGRDPEKVLTDVLQRHLESFRLSGVETAKQGASIDLKYQVQLRSVQSMTALVTELNQVEGVQSVEVRA